MIVLIVTAVVVALWFVMVMRAPPLGMTRGEYESYKCLSDDERQRWLKARSDRYEDAGGRWASLL